ncbi:MAG: hypothetical protein WEC14_03555 [Chloroflexota bacterium]
MTGELARRTTSARWLAPVIAILGSVCLVVAGFLPVWGTRLVAPQYPKGLDLWFYGGRVEGPLREVNALNHYIGMQPIDLAAVPELALWPLAVVGSTVLLLVALFGPGQLGRLASVGLFLLPVIVLADIQRWLIVFGTQLDRTSALRLDPFVPLVVGHGLRRRAEGRDEHAAGRESGRPQPRRAAGRRDRQPAACRGVRGEQSLRRQRYRRGAHADRGPRVRRQHLRRQPVGWTLLPLALATSVVKRRDG